MQKTDYIEDVSLRFLFTFPQYFSERVTDKNFFKLSRKLIIPLSLIQNTMHKIC